MSPQNNHLQRPPAAVLYADELAKLKQNDNAPCPPGWQLSSDESPNDFGKNH
ncbi:hypothetical protein WP5S17E10_15750 [Escherichia coli]|nr:hypothetical protein WP5S17E10_15750 [Escherichia coli]